MTDKWIATVRIELPTRDFEGEKIPVSEVVKLIQEMLAEAGMDIPEAVEAGFRYTIEVQQEGS